MARHVVKTLAAVALCGPETLIEIRGWDCLVVELRRDPQCSAILDLLDDVIR